MRQELISTLSRFLDWLVPEQIRAADADARRRARLVVGFTLALVIWGPIFSVVYVALGLPQFSVAVLIAAALGILNIAAFRRTGSISQAGNLMTLILFGIIAYLTLSSDGANSPAISWFVPIPMLATMILGYRSGVIWLLVNLAMLAVLYLEAGSQWAITVPLDARQVLIWGFSAITAITIVVYSLALIYEKLKDTALNSLQAASRAKSEFLANMSHEIRTPLTAILGYTDLLLEDTGNSGGKERLKENVATIKRAGEHLLTIVNDILDLSKIEAGKFRIEQVECNLPVLLLEVAALMNSRAVAKGLTLKLRLVSKIPQQVCTDPTRLRQILLNLVGNAVKFTDHGGVEISVAVVDQQANKMLQIDILDTGMGMTPVQAADLFKPFSQGDGSVTRRFGGTGLGLIICRRLAGLMGGLINLEQSALGEGSLFRLTVPITVPPGAAWTEILERSKPIERIAATPTTVRGRVLLAEDGKENQLLVAYYLRKAGIELDIADNGRIALEMLEKATACDINGRNGYDLLVTDMQMPEIDGYTLAQTLRERGSSIPIIALTANAMAEDRDKCLAAGCDDYTTKPVNKAQLLSKCAVWLGRRADGITQLERATT